MDNFRQDLEKVKSLNAGQYSALLKISRKLNEVSFEDSLINEVLDFLISVIEAERGIFAKYDEPADKFSIISARKISGENISDLAEFSSGVLKTVVDRKEPVIYHDIQNQLEFSQYQSVQLNRIKSVLGVPIIRDDKVWGVVIVDSKTNRKEFTEDNLLFLNFFSSMVTLALDKIIAMDRLSTENRLLSGELSSYVKIPEIIGESKVMLDLFKLIHKVAATDANVLILGESGTGKELVARAIHNFSPREKKSFVAQFCGSIPENLLESELFGYKKGAFTGASTDKKGLLESADGGTFLLDEISEISDSIQSKLLRVIENREIIRLGDVNVKKIDVRLLAAANKDLKQLVKEGKFREDLYYRLNVFPIKVPPLRDRLGDIPLLADFYLKKFSNGEKKKLTRRALSSLENYDWPGNVRQLVNIIHRAVILSEGDTITDEQIMIEEGSSASLEGKLKEIEKNVLAERLKRYEGNKSLAAESLGVSVRWVQLKVKEYNFEQEN